MKNLLTPFLLLTVLLSACGPVEEPIAEEPLIEEPEIEPKIAATDEMLSSEQKINEDQSVSVSIYWENTLVKTIEKDPGEYEVVLFDQTADSAYIAVNRSGLGGYILYGGAYSLYELNLTTKDLVPVFETEASAFVTDVSPDGESIVTFTSNEAGEIILSIYSTEEYKKGEGYTDVTYIVPEEYAQAGDGVFSPDGKKLAYAASIPAENIGTGLEKTIVFIIDLDTGKSEEFKQIDGLVNVSWDSGEEPTLQ